MTSADLEDLDLLAVGGPTHAQGAPRAIGAWLAGIGEAHVRDLPVAAFDTRYKLARLLTGSVAHVVARPSRSPRPRASS